MIFQVVVVPGLKTSISLMHTNPLLCYVLLRSPPTAVAAPMIFLPLGAYYQQHAQKRE